LKNNYSGGIQITKITTARFKDDEYEIVKEVSSMYGETITNFMKKAYWIE